jgi:Domain of unknown function (DUF5011)/Bacterial Ig domain
MAAASNGDIYVACEDWSVDVMFRNTATQANLYINTAKVFKWIAVHPSGDIYAGDTNANQIVHLSPAGIVLNTFATSVSPNVIHSDAAGNIYVLGGNVLEKFNASGVSLASYSLWASASDFDFDAAWNVYVVHAFPYPIVNGTVTKISVGWVVTPSYIVVWGYTFPYDIAVDGSAIYVTASATNQLKKYVATVQNLTDAVGNEVTFATSTDDTITFDMTIPVVTLIWSGTITLPVWWSYTELWASWVDYTNATWTALPYSGSVNTWVVGIYTLSYTYTDTAGNTGNIVTRTVNITDQAAPVVTLIWSGTITIAQWSSYTELWASWSDNVDGTGSIATAYSGSVNTWVLWTYTLSYTYTDSAGNTGNIVTRTVNVTDQTAPIPPVFTVPVPFVPASTPVTWTGGESGGIVTITDGSGVILGTWIVDASGNVSILLPTITSTTPSPLNITTCDLAGNCTTVTIAVPTVVFVTLTYTSATGGTLSW